MMGCAGSKDGDLVTGRQRTDSKHTKTNRVRPFSYPTKARVAPEQNEAYCNKMRKDVMDLLQSFDLEKDSEDLPVLPRGEIEYRDMLKRWITVHNKQSAVDGSLTVDAISLQQKPPGADSNNLDPNLQPFPVSEGTVDQLREYLRQPSWEPMNTTLQHGETAWLILPENVIKNGLTTPEQQSILAARDRRRKLHDAERMRRRREELAHYFVKRYRMKKERLDVYLQWADVLSRNQADLESLCR